MTINVTSAAHWGGRVSGSGGSAGSGDAGGDGPHVTMMRNALERSSTVDDRSPAVASREALPTVGVVIPTRDRPELLRAAIASVLAQDYPGPVEILVVFDGTEPDRTLEASGTRPVRAVPNTRTPGLCGSRNTGILALETELVAFLDDDDEWLPGKLSAQVARLQREQDAEFATTSIVINYGGTSAVRRAGVTSVGYPQLLRSRMAMLHSSTFLARRGALLDGIGLTEESIPGGMCEDWDLLLRAAHRRDIAHVDEPLVQVRWGTTSYFAQRWETKIRAHQWMLEHHPDIAGDPVGSARVYGQLAFSSAALGRRRDALRWASRAVRQRPREPRAYLALTVAARLTTSERVLAALHRRGHGV